MSTAQNHLIELLPRKARNSLTALCVPVHLELFDVLCEPGDATRFVYFPTEGFISLLALNGDRSSLEVGMVGNEGMLGVQLALGVGTAPLRALVQGSGTALRISARAFRGEVAASPALQRLVARYVYVLMTQLAASAGCLRFHLIGPRLARWLLMSHDRAGTDSFPVTHEFLASMLGAQRAGVTVAAGDLQRRKLVEYRRGQLTVLDRKGLEKFSCGWYLSGRNAYSASMN